MSLFDRYMAVDWSAANRPRTDTDSIWIAEVGPEGPRPSANPPTRAAAMALLGERLATARAADERILVGMDFAFGYPRGAARAIAGKRGWAALWDVIAAAIEDGDDNRSNRFEVASSFNRVLDQHHFWGHPPHHRYADLQPRRPGHGYPYIPERRMAEIRAGTAQPVWKLSGIGSVGSQSLLGIKRLHALRRSMPGVAIWPFETDFERALGPITVAEIYPSLFHPAGIVLPLDREQVETVAQDFAGLDGAGLLAEFLSAPQGVGGAERDLALEEEGWIAGVGHEHLLTSRALPRKRAYLRDPDAIYRRSFSIIEAEADLSALSPDMRPVAIRMIHACGMVDIAAQIRASSGVVGRIAAALAAGAPILCDCEAVRAGIIARALQGNDVVTTLNDPAISELAKRLGTTRSAAGAELWRDRLEGAVVVIGNAPTALFHLLDMLDAGAARPAAIIATPVGFVGAEESKAELALGRQKVPFITLLGRRGGSAMAAAALNAIARSVDQ